jgi:hypothetical protein
MAAPGGSRERFGGPTNGLLVDLMIKQPEIMKRALPKFLEGSFPDLDGFAGTVAGRMPPAYTVGVMWPNTPEAQRALAIGLAGLIKEEVVPHVSSIDADKVSLTFNSLMLAATIDPPPDQLLPTLKTVPKEKIPSPDELIDVMHAHIDLGEFLDKAIQQHSATDTVSKPA